MNSFFSWSNVQNSCLGGPRASNNCEIRPRWKDSYNGRAIDRKVRRRSFGSYWIVDRGDPGNTPQLPGTSPSCDTTNAGLGKLTPFRRAMNAGDPYGTVNMPPSSTLAQKPANQINAPRRASLAGALSLASSGVRTVDNGSAFTGNPKFVYDSSDYIKYKQMKAKNNNYNDSTFGGDQHYASQVPLSRVRRGIGGV